jgi:hypothetical protein
MSTGDYVDQTSHGAPPTRSGWTGYIGFAGIMMFVLGCFHAITGLVAIFDSEYYLVGKNGLIVEVDYTVWGWTHLVLGALIALAGAFLTTGAAWARAIAVVAAVVSAVVNLSFLSAYPIWSALMITFDVLVIYAVTVHGSRESLEGY